VSVQESDVVATLYDPAVNFSGIETYGMPDSIQHIKENESDTDEISRKYDEDILNLIAANLDARGFQRLDESSPDSPDVLVFVSATEITNWYAYSYYPGDYWGWYGGYPGWGWYYPYYPSYGVSYAYTTGTLIVDMVEPDKPDTTTKTIPNLWRGVCNGVLDDVETSKVHRFTDSINQMFAQSPYLQSAQ